MSSSTYNTDVTNGAGEKEYVYLYVPFSVPFSMPTQSCKTLHFVLIVNVNCSTRKKPGSHKTPILESNVIQGAVQFKADYFLTRNISK